MHDAAPFRLRSLRLSGPDAIDFAQAQFTADVARLPERQWSPAAWCDSKGRVLAVMLLAPVSEDFYLALPEPLADAIAKRLRMYQIGRKVTISDPEAIRCRSLDPSEGPASASTAMGAKAPPPGEADDAPAGDPDAGWPLAYDASRSMTPGGPEDGGSDGSAWLAADIEQGLPWILPETAGQFLPQMLGLEALGGLSYRKGCWPGQEVVARVRYRGRLTRITRRFGGDGESPEPGARIEVEGSDGVVLFAVPVPKSAVDGPDHVGLAVIPNSAESDVSNRA